jgi:hypothetical protein
VGASAQVAAAQAEEGKEEAVQVVEAPAVVAMVREAKASVVTATATAAAVAG